MLKTSYRNDIIQSGKLYTGSYRIFLDMNSMRKKYMTSYSTRDITLERKILILSQFKFLDGLKVEEISYLALKLQPKIMRPMEVFVEEDLDEHHAFFIYQGAVSVFRTTEDGEIINTDINGAPELAGEMGLVATEPSISSVMAIGEVHTLVLSQDDYQEIIEKYPHISNNFLTFFAYRMRDFNLFIEELLSKKLYDRTWTLIQFLSKYYPEREIKLSHEELADLIWGSRSRVTEVLNQLEKENKIKATHRKIKILK